MGKLRRFYKRYERFIMLGIVIMLLATFSVTSALCTGGADGGATGKGYQLGGSFLVEPGVREDVSDGDFDRQFASWRSFFHATRMTTIAFRRHLGNTLPPNPVTGAWAGYAARRCAEQAGYVVGPHQLKSAVGDMVSFRVSMAVSEAIYAKFLRERYRGSPAAFQDSVRNVLLRDAFLDPLVQVSRYAVTYDEAFDEWKRERERVDLEYISLSGAPFAEIVELEERSRLKIAVRERSLLDVRQALGQVRSLSTHLEALKMKTGGDGTYPDALDAIVKEKRLQTLPGDPWSGEWTYTRSDDGASFTLVSAGPDGKPGTADDVSRATLKDVRTHGNLRDMVRAVYEWRGGANAWPTELADLLKPAVEGSAPPMARLRQDGHDQDFVYEVATGEGTPSIVGMGPDGKAGTEDDVRFIFEQDGDTASSVLPVGAGLATLMAGAEQDAWARPLSVVLESAQPITWRVFSMGPDGKPGTEDDVEGGNDREMEAFYARPGIKQQYRLPLRRQIEALYVQLSVFPDDVLKRLWNAHPKLHPTNEEQLFNTWQEHRGPGRFYSAEDPKDPKTGHGAEIAAKLAPEGTHYLVPDASIFPAQLGPATKDEDEEKKDDDEEKEDDGEEPEDESDDGELLRNKYRDEGWRQILLRERFMDNLLRDLLQRLSDSQDAVAAWDLRYADQPDDAPAPVRPILLTFDSLLEGELAPYLVGAADADKGNQTFRLYRTKLDPDAPDEQGDERTVWESHAEFGDTLITVDLSGRTDDGEYVGRVVPLQQRQGRILLRNLKFFPARDQRLEEVRDEVFALYVKERETSRAERALKELQELAPKPVKDEDLSTTTKKWEVVLATWSEKLGVPYQREWSGMFIGSNPPQPVRLEKDDDLKLPTDEASMAIRRRNFVWRAGYDTIRPLGSRQDPTSGLPGTFGRRVLPDTAIDQGGTGAAYLIRVAARVYPDKREFSPRRYTAFLSTKAFGASKRLQRGSQIRDHEGTFYVALWRFTGEPDFLRGSWGLRTNSALESFDR